MSSHLSAILLLVLSMTSALGGCSPAESQSHAVNKEASHQRPNPEVLPFDRSTQRSALITCRRDHSSHINSEQRTNLDLGQGISAAAPERVDQQPTSSFHLTYRDGTSVVEVYGDGTIDIMRWESQVSRSHFRYHVPKGDISDLAEHLREINVWNLPREVLHPADVDRNEMDLTMDGRRQTRIDVHSGQRALQKAIEDAARLTRIDRDPGLRLRLLRNAGFEFNSIEGADLALAMVMQHGYSDNDLEALLHYDIPCDGGLYASRVPPIETPRAWTLQDALIANGLNDLAQRFGPIPPLTKVVAPNSVKWTRLPSAADFIPSYPPRALEEQVQKAATIECRLSADGRVTDCEVVADMAREYGFGPATAQVFEAHAQAEVGTFSSGARVRYRHQWMLPQ